MPDINPVPLATGDDMPFWAQYDPSFDVPGVDTIIRGFVSNLSGQIIQIFTFENTATAGIKRGLLKNLYSSGTNLNLRITATNGNNEQMTVTGSATVQDQVVTPEDCNQSRLNCLVCCHQNTGGGGGTLGCATCCGQCFNLCNGGIDCNTHPGLLDFTDCVQGVPSAGSCFDFPGTPPPAIHSTQQR